MAYWFGDEDSWYNEVVDAEREMRQQFEQDNVTTGPGALAMFGPPAGSAGLVARGLSSIGLKGRAATALTTDLALDAGPASTVLEEGPGWDPNEAFSDAIDTAADATGSDGSEPDPAGLPTWAYALAALVILWLIRPILELLVEAVEVAQ